MQYIKENELLWDFEAWSGGKDTLEVLKAYGMDMVEGTQELIEMCFEETPTETEINDFLWFERQTIAEYNGFENFDEMLTKCPMQ